METIYHKCKGQQNYLGYYQYTKIDHPKSHETMKQILLAALALVGLALLAASIESHASPNIATTLVANKSIEWVVQYGKNDFGEENGFNYVKNSIPFNGMRIQNGEEDQPIQAWLRCHGSQTLLSVYLERKAKMMQPWRLDSMTLSLRVDGRKHEYLRGIADDQAIRFEGRENEIVSEVLKSGKAFEAVVVITDKYPPHSGVKYIFSVPAIRNFSERLQFAIDTGKVIQAKNDKISRDSIVPKFHGVWKYNPGTDTHKPVNHFIEIDSAKMMLSITCNNETQSFPIGVVYNVPIVGKEPLGRNRIYIQLLDRESNGSGNIMLGHEIEVARGKPNVCHMGWALSGKQKIGGWSMGGGDFTRIPIVQTAAPGHHASGQ